MEKKRLSKTMAAAGVASRRACEELIFDGRVSVNGKVILEPQTLVNGQRDVIQVDDERIGKAEAKVYYLLNKPIGFVCTNHVSKNSPRVVDLFPKSKQRLFTVGRLDKETTGLLLVTNDGQFANEVIHPSNDIQKEYVARVHRPLTHEHLITIGSGCRAEGVFVKPLRVRKMRRNTVKITVTEGKKHEVRLFLAKAGLEVLELARVRLGNLSLGDLALGRYKTLTLDEAKRLFD